MADRPVPAARIALLVSILALAACAGRPPEISATGGYGIAAGDVEAADQAFAGALDSLLDAGSPGGTALAEVTVSRVRYNSDFIGLFVGGRHWAEMATVLTDAGTGRRIGQFDFYVGVGGDEANAASRLAAKAADMIRAKASTYPVKRAPVTPSAPAQTRKPGAVNAPVVAVAAPAKPVVDPLPPAPVFDPVVPPTPPAPPTPAPAGDEPCIIGADGKCLPL